MAHIKASFSVTERRACKLAGQPRSVERYRLKAKPADDVLKVSIRQLAFEFPAAGYRTVYQRLKAKGVSVGLRKTAQLYRQMGLSVRIRPKRRIKCTVRQPMEKASSANHTWSMDYVSEQLSDGRNVRIFAAVDNFSRQCVALDAASSLPACAVIQVLESAIKQHGNPRTLVCDNGPEFRSKDFQAWASKLGIAIHFIEPGKPIQNAFAESFNGRLRAECLNTHWFTNLAQLRSTLAAWLRDYNEARPHSALGGLSPLAFLTHKHAA